MSTENKKTLRDFPTGYSMINNNNRQLNKL